MKQEESKARYTAQIVAMVDDDTKARIQETAKQAGVSAGVVIRVALRHGLGMAQREAQRGKLREQ